MTLPNPKSGGDDLCVYVVKYCAGNSTMIGSTIDDCGKPICDDGTFDCPTGGVATCDPEGSCFEYFQIDNSSSNDSLCKPSSAFIRSPGNPHQKYDEAIPSDEIVLCVTPDHHADIKVGPGVVVRCYWFADLSIGIGVQVKGVSSPGQTGRIKGPMNQVGNLLFADIVWDGMNESRSYTMILEN